MKRLRSVISGFRSHARQAKGVAGKLRVSEVTLKGQRTIHPSGGAKAAIGVPMKELGGRRLYVRPGTTDLQSASDFYWLGVHLPSDIAAGGGVNQICELGCNIGAALTALAVRYPEASLLGVEPDADNAAIARRNTAPFGERCVIVEAGIWDVEAELVVDTSNPNGEHGFTVRPRLDSDPPDRPSVEALDIDSLLDRYMPDGEIDHMIVNIEGTQPRVFAAGGLWTKRVRAMKIETHPEFGYPVDDCIEQLQALGYEAHPDPVAPGRWVTATRV